MDTNLTGQVSLTFVCDNEVWLNIISEGMDPPEVTGGMVQLPQGGMRESRAAVTGGTYFAGAEPASQARENFMKKTTSLLPEQIKEALAGGLDGAEGSIKGLEEFFTSLAKQELLVVRDEYCDNDDERIATDGVIDSIRAVITVNGIPTTDDIKQLVVQELQSALGGGGT